MNKQASRYFDATSDFLGSSTCTCSECGTAFCVSRRDHEPSSCKECKTCDPLVFYFGRESLQNTADSDHKTKSLKYIQLGEDSTDITSQTLYKPSSKNRSGVTDNAEDLRPKDQDFHMVSKDDAPKITSTTTAQLSAQIMNVSYKEFKESVSAVKAEKIKYNTNDIFKRIKEAYDACSCKICECITGKSILFPNDDCGCSPCDCEPCNCKDCKNVLSNIGIDPRVRYFKRPATVLERINTGFTKQNENSGCSCKPCNCDACTYMNCNKDILNIAIESRMNGIKKRNAELERINSGLSEADNCDCKPCDCIKCQKNYSKPCECKPCQCYECQSVRALEKKTVIVAPVGEGTQRANCLCAPCDCARCSHRGLNLTPNRVHEMSTGINRHPNCHCEACVDDSCEPNGTGSCRCEGRHGVISKPVENNPHDYDIRRATVSSKPMKSTFESRFVRNSTFVAMNINKFPPGNSKDFNKQSCKCGVCECIVCKCKGNDFSSSKSSQNFDNGLKTLKLPSRELKNCQCTPCECEYCSMKKKTHFSESTEFKSCTCEKCDCLHCEGELKPKHTLSKLIPVTGMGSREMCQCKPCECKDCKKMVTSRNVDTCHCVYCQCEHCADEANVSHEALYPIKKGEILTPSMIRKDPLSQPELLRQSSEYTHIKPSMAQSNVFNPSRVPEKTQQNFTIFHMVQETNIKQQSFNPAVPLQSVNQRKLDSNVKSKFRTAKIKSTDQSKENLKNWNQFYYPSTSKTVTENEPSILIKKYSNHREDDETSLNDGMMAISNLSRAPSLMAIPQSTHNLVYLTPTSDLCRTSCNLSVSSSNRKARNTVKTLRKQKEINYEKGSTDTDNLELSRCHHCGSSYANSEITKETCNVITQTPVCNITNYNPDTKVFEDPILKSLLSDNSDSSLDNIPRQAKYVSKDDKKYISKNKFHAWRFEYPNPGSFSVDNMDMKSHNKSAPYETALMTLKRAKEFSLELVTLLQKYDKANSEFESISKKLKKSHESMLNDFKNDIYGRNYMRTSSLKNYDDCMNFNNDASQTMCLNNRKTKIIQQFWTTYNDNLNTNVSAPLICESNRKYTDAKRNIFKELSEIEKNGIEKNAFPIKPVTGIPADSPLVKSINILENESSKKNTNNNNKNDSVSENAHEKLSPTIHGKMELSENLANVENSSCGYKAYKKLVKRSANIARRLNHKNTTPIDNGCDATLISTQNTVETNLLKKIIRQEIKNILNQFDEIKKSPTSSSASAEEAQVKNEIFRREKPIKIKYDEPVAERSRQHDTKSLTDNKPVVNNKGSTTNVPEHEAMEVAKTPSTLISAAKQSPSNNKKTVLERLQKEVKELLNMTMLQTTSTDVFKKSSKALSPTRSWSVMDAKSAAPAVKTIDEQKTYSISKSKLKEARRRTINSTIVLAKYPKSDPSVPVGNKKCACDELKATSISLRRVSDHTVMVKWEAPRHIQDIKGFEVLVDGKPVEKLFGQSERMAVVTCLPHYERVQLAVRSVGRAACCGHDICRTALYRPRDK